MAILKKVIGLFLLMGACGVIQSQILLDDSLEQFLERAEKDKGQKEGFRIYYSKFLEEQNKLYKSGRRKKLARLRSTALTTLRDKKPEWYKVVEPYSLDLEESTQECRKVRLFLTRYALFDAYKQGTPAKVAGTRERVKNFLRPVKQAFVFVKDKVKGLFGKKSKA